MSDALTRAMREKQALLDAIQAAGGQCSLADACNVTQPAVSLWIRRGLPATRVLEVAVAAQMDPRRLCESYDPIAPEYQPAALRSETHAYAE